MALCKEYAASLFEGAMWKQGASPYMSFAPKLTDAACAAHPAICHYDNTTRPQTVRKEDEAWVYELLCAVGRRTGSRVLCNTSFNTRGKPILNTIRDALALLDQPGLGVDYVVLEADSEPNPNPKPTRHPNWITSPWRTG